MVCQKSRAAQGHYSPSLKWSQYCGLIWSLIEKFQIMHYNEDKTATAHSTTPAKKGWSVIGQKSKQLLEDNQGLMRYPLQSFKGGGITSWHWRECRADVSRFLHPGNKPSGQSSHHPWQWREYQGDTMSVVWACSCTKRVVWPLQGSSQLPCFAIIFCYPTPWPKVIKRSPSGLNY